MHFRIKKEHEHKKKRGDQIPKTSDYMEKDKCEVQVWKPER
jgi:hypothetical protein